MNALRKVVCYLSVSLAALFVASCGSPLVGLECRDGFERCGRACYDLSSDPQHCGGCDIACAPDQQCVESMCRAAVPGDDAGDAGDGGVGDAGDGGAADASSDGGDDGGIDGSLDSGLDGGDLDAGDGSLVGQDGSANDGAAGDGASGDGSTGGGDGATGDGSTGDGSTGGGDGATGDGGNGGDGGVTLPELCTGPASPEDCICGLGQLRCGNICVDANTDRNNCGDCGIVCEAEEYCAAGICAPICAPPLTLCAGLCVNLMDSNAHCGMCNNACEAVAACIDGECVGRAVGHIVLIGHDMSAARAPMQTMVGNAVFLVRRTPLRVLAFDETTNNASRTGVSTAIQAAAQTINRTYSLTSANPALLSAQLGNADVFVIETQHGATDDRMRELGSMWSAALSTFLFRGGVIVVFDAGGTNSGTHQILEGAGLFEVDSRMALARPQLSLVTASDAVASSVPTEYQAEGQTAGFVVDLVANPATVVIRDPMSMLPVVLHRVVVE